MVLGRKLKMPKIRYKGTYTIQFVNSHTTKQFPSLYLAMLAAENYCGNNVYTQVQIFSEFPNKYLYGPGDGTVSTIISEDFDLID